MISLKISGSKYTKGSVSLSLLNVLYLFSLHTYEIKIHFGGEQVSENRLLRITMIVLSNYD